MSMSAADANFARATATGTAAAAAAVTARAAEAEADNVIPIPRTDASGGADAQRGTARHGAGVRTGGTMHTDVAPPPCLTAVPCSAVPLLNARPPISTPR